MKRSNTVAAVNVETSHAVGVLRRDAAAKYLGISIPALDRMTADGSGPPKCRLAGRCFGFRVIDLETWLASRVESRAAA
jgi:predicted DNA-binding transcriptional regulator AlpA